MKKIIALLLTAFLLVLPVTAGFQEEANAYGVAYTINQYFEKPALNGQFQEYSYTKLPIAPGDVSYAWNDGIDGTEDIAKGLDFSVYVSYDANNVYIFVDSDAKYYYNEYDDGDGSAWQQSAIQVSIAAGSDVGGDRLEYGIWKNSLDGNLGGVVWAQHPDAQAEFTPTAGENYTVVVEGGRVKYETIVPVNTFLNKAAIAEGEVIGLNIVIVQSKPDDPGYIHTQLASGCTGDPGKDAERFAKLTLGGVMDGPPPPVVEEEAPPAVGGGDAAPEPPVIAPTPAPAAPQTGDAGMIAVVALLAVAAAGIVVFRKKSLNK